MSNENIPSSVQNLWKILANLIKTLIGDVDLTKGDLQTQIDETKKSVSDGKTLVAVAITEKGVETAADATFAVMADNISQIETGVELHGAIISVTTDEETLIGKDVVLLKEDVVVETVKFDSNGICSFIVQESGDYVVRSSDGSESTSESVTVTNDNIIDKTALPITLTLHVDGATVVPVDDVMIWLKCGRVRDKNYTTIDEVIADTDTLFMLMSDENAMKYLERSTGFADAICADETSMTYLGQSPYVDETVLNSDIGVESICNSDYFECVFDPLIPTMTSNNTPSGVASYSTCYSTTYENAYHAFDKNMDTHFTGHAYTMDVSGEWIQYQFDEPKKSIIFEIKHKDTSTRIDWQGELLGSNDNSTFTSLKTFTMNKLGGRMVIPNNSLYKSYRVVCRSEGSEYRPEAPDYRFIVDEMQLYGRT